MEAGGEIPHLKESVGADGKQYPRRPVSIFNPTRREEKAIQNPAVVERIAEEGKSGCSISGLIISPKIGGYREPLIPLVTVATVDEYTSGATVSTVGNGSNGCFIPTVRLHLHAYWLTPPNLRRAEISAG